MSKGVKTELNSNCNTKTICIVISRVGLQRLEILGVRLHNGTYINHTFYGGFGVLKLFIAERYCFEKCICKIKVVSVTSVTLLAEPLNFKYA